MIKTKFEYAFCTHFRKVHITTYEWVIYSDSIKSSKSLETPVFLNIFVYRRLRIDEILLLLELVNIAISVGVKPIFIKTQTLISISEILHNEYSVSLK